MSSIEHETTNPDAAIASLTQQYVDRHVPIARVSVRPVVTRDHVKTCFLDLHCVGSFAWDWLREKPEEVVASRIEWAVRDMAVQLFVAMEPELHPELMVGHSAKLRAYIRKCVREGREP